MSIADMWKKNQGDKELFEEMYNLEIKTGNKNKATGAVAGEDLAKGVFEHKPGLLER